MSYRAIKIKLFPTREQEKLLWQSAGTARFAYNLAKKFADTYYRLYKKSLNTEKLKKDYEKQALKRLQAIQGLSPEKEVLFLSIIQTPNLLYLTTR